MEILFVSLLSSLVAAKHSSPPPPTFWKKKPRVSTKQEGAKTPKKEEAYKLIEYLKKKT